MVFSSIVFLYWFLPFTLLLYYLFPKKHKNTVLLIMSLIFYSWGEPVYIVVMLCAILLSFVEGLLIERYQSKKILIISIMIHLLVLGYYKYFGFILENLQTLGIYINANVPTLPIGISFYTFQIISYLIDVYRQDCQAQRSIIAYGCYISMFPQLIAGPIVRYVDIEEQLSSRKLSIQKFLHGFERFVIGLAKKVLLANVLSELCLFFHSTQEPSVLYCWMYAIAFTLQIYFDFSGYSDMAIGLGHMLGFTLMENFDYPYMSRSITEFWRRWHMSLGKWFRDYVYIPMGGNRKHIVLNIFVVWLLTGLWHGAAWNFILWGLLFGVILLLEKKYYLDVLKRHPIFGRCYVLLIVVISFVIFDNSIKDALSILSHMLMINYLPMMTTESLYYLDSYKIVLIISILCTTPIVYIVYKKLPQRLRFLGYLVLFGIVSISLVGSSYNPFLYFRF